MQSGFRKKHSTETAAVYLVDTILAQMDRQNYTGTVFVDLKKAFDLVNHKCLLSKLDHYGVRGHSLQWFQNYLTTRFQRVQYNGKLSERLPVEFGVPQGSLLGPLMFVMYINDFPLSLKYSSISMYANDSIIYVSGSSVEMIKEHLQKDIYCVEQWMYENQLLFNQDRRKRNVCFLEQDRNLRMSWILNLTYSE